MEARFASTPEGLSIPAFVRAVLEEYIEVFMSDDETEEESEGESASEEESGESTAVECEEQPVSGQSLPSTLCALKLISASPPCSRELEIRLGQRH